MTSHAFQIAQSNLPQGNELAALERVSKSYGSTVALDGLTLHVREGELLAVLGPNGAGKSTAIALLLGLLRPDRGVARLFGRTAPTLLERRQIGVMMQEVVLPADLKGREHIDLASSYYPSAYALDELIALTQIGSFCDKRYGELSGGQKRQIQFAVAICGRPRLLFLDEPTVGLDIEARARMWSVIRALISQGCSIVLTTHYLEEAEALADRVAVIAKGKLIADGSVREIRSIVSRKTISCITSLPAEALKGWTGVQSVEVDGERTTLTVIEAEPVVRKLLASDPRLADLEVHRAGLAEAFLELTQQEASS
jgi:ABC-type multidrug transport system, ATPase component